MPPNFSRVVPSSAVASETNHTSMMETIFRRIQSRKEDTNLTVAESDPANQRSVAAGVLAALMENIDLASVMKKAKERFRCVDC